MEGGFLPRWIFQNQFNTPVPWMDHLVELKLLQQANAFISSPEFDGDPEEYLARINNALKHRDHRDMDGNFLDGDAARLYDAARDEVENDQWAASTLGYFTGIYPKFFTDAYAELLRTRTEINSLKWSLNNSIQADILGYDSDVERMWADYLEKRYDGVDGFMYNLYNTLRWAKTPEGDPVYGMDRRDMVTLAIEQMEQSEARYLALGNAREQLTKDLKLAGVGADNSMRAKAWERYWATVGSIEAMELYDVSNREWFVGYKPEKLAWRDIRNLFWSTFEKTRPKQLPGEDFTSYEARLQLWKSEIPLQVLYSAPLWGELASIEWMDEAMNKPDMIMSRLTEEATGEGYELWRMENDTILDAANNIWYQDYWGPYWNALEPARNTNERSLLEEKFAAQWGPEGKPSLEYVAQRILEQYEGIKDWTLEQIIEELQGSPITSAEERLQQDTLEDTSATIADLDERMWDVIFALGPGYPQREEFLKAV
jgi:hypothetical protein